jgi:hypothetical protein
MSLNIYKITRHHIPEGNTFFFANYFDKFLEGNQSHQFMIEISVGDLFWLHPLGQWSANWGKLPQVGYKWNSWG